MTDAAYAALCARVYDLPGLGDEFACHAETIGELQVIAFRGTKSLYEWLMDALAFPSFDLATPVDIRLGPVHAGFLAGATKLLPQTAQAAQGRRFALTGHSLGGALATVVGGLLTLSGTPPQEIITFGGPRAGMGPLVTVLQHVAIRQYRYHADPVPDLPSDPPFRHPRALIQLGTGVGWNPSDHHIEHYIEGLSHAA